MLEPCTLLTFSNFPSAWRMINYMGVVTAKWE